MKYFMSEIKVSYLPILQNAFDYCQKTAERQIINMLMYVENEMLYPNISQQSRVSQMNK